VDYLNLDDPLLTGLVIFAFFVLAALEPFPFCVAARAGLGSAEMVDFTIGSMAGLGALGAFFDAGSALGAL